MRIRTARDIGLLLKEARKRRGLSQAALARMINTTQTWVSWVENGKPGAEIGNVLLALTTLGVEMNFDLPAPPPDGDQPGGRPGDRHVDDDRHGDDDDDDRHVDDRPADDDDAPPYKL